MYIDHIILGVHIQSNAYLSALFRIKQGRGNSSALYSSVYHTGLAAVSKPVRWEIATPPVPEAQCTTSRRPSQSRPMSIPIFSSSAKLKLYLHFHFSNPIYGIIISPFEMIPTFAILLFPSASIVPCKFSNHQRITTSLVWLSIPIIQHNRSIRKRINTI